MLNVDFTSSQSLDVYALERYCIINISIFETPCSTPCSAIINLKSGILKSRFSMVCSCLIDGLLQTDSLLHVNSILSTSLGVLRSVSRKEMYVLASR